jgi:hypothetical protein
MHIADMGQIFSSGIKGDHFKLGRMPLRIDRGEAKTQEPEQ